MSTPRPAAAPRSVHPDAALPSTLLLCCALALVPVVGACGPDGSLWGNGQDGSAAEAGSDGAEGQSTTPVSAGDPDRRLADTGEMPIDPVEACDLDAGPYDPSLAAGDSPYAADKVSFRVQFKDEVNPHRIMSTMVMPGESMQIEPVLTNPRSTISVSAEAGELRRVAEGRWEWTAPEEPGIHCITIADTAAGEVMCINAFVLTPYDGGESLNGYRIGQYPTELYKGLEAYRRPTGLIEVTEENKDTWVSPHFQLQQFLCKQESGWPKYLLLRTRLLLKLEMLLEEVNQEGIDASTFYVMSAYRTPHYNAAIGNQTSFSRHTFGDAADIFVDMDGNGVMDDIDGSGQVTVDDARLLFDMVDGMFQETWYRPFVGGMGLYGPAPHRGPFLHTDTRGFRARW